MFQNGACYIRVSTDDQTEYSPDAQLKAIKQYAKNNNIILTKEHIYVDEGISGKRADKRPAFQNMIANAKSKPKPFDVILVHKFDRFARSREDSVVYKSLLKKECGIRVISITESIEDDKFSVILEAMLEAMAEYYSLNLAEEVKKGMTEKAERGGYQTCPMFGYRAENKKLVVVPEEAEIIKFIFEKYATQKMNMRQLTVYINELGFRTKRGNIFETRNIEYILNNPAYIGKLRWTPTGKIRRDYHNPDTIIANAEHEPLISMELWNKVQEILKDNRELYRTGTHTTANVITWLKGMIKCGTCGRAMVISQHKYLMCNGFVKGQCKTSNHIGYEILENAVLKELKKVYDDPMQINIVPKANDDSLTYQYEFLVSQLSKMKDKEQRIKKAYADGIDTLEEYKENKERLINEKNQMENQLNEIEENLKGINDPNLNIKKRILTVSDILTDNSIDTETKNKTALMLINKIKFSKISNTLEIEFK